MRLYQTVFLFLIPVLSLSVPAQEVAAPEPVGANLNGTVVDLEAAPIPSATVVLDGPNVSDHATAQANETGFFAFHGLRPGVSYHIKIQAPGFAALTPAAIVLKPGEQADMGALKMTIATVETSVTAMTTEQIATAQVKEEEKQRILGVVPNFYVAYDPKAVPLTSKLKYELAFRASTDLVTFVGVAVIAGIDHAADTPSYGQGADAFGQRMGANYANTFTGIMIGGAVLPSLLHQDPRYFYQGTGTTKSRLMHAIESPFICKGDNGKWQFNASTIGGDIASGAISNLYYPDQDRGVGRVFEGAAINSVGRMASAVAQEFLFRRYTSHSSGTTP